MIADARDILQGRDNVKQEPESSGALQRLLGTDEKKKKKPPKKPAEPTFKRPQGMHREVYNLLVTNDGKGGDPPPIMPSHKHSAYKQPKARLGMSKARPWKWTPFRNAARRDELMLYHWRRTDRIEEEYPFAKFNRKIEVPKYTEEEYHQWLRTNSFSKEETDKLMELAAQFDIRWFIVHDRFVMHYRAIDKDHPSGQKSVEDLKERYYNVYNKLSKERAGPDEQPVILNFDADHERRRKAQLIKLWNRTDEQIEEEEKLLVELKKIEARKKERERKAQDLQKLITAAERNPVGQASSSGGGSAVKKKLPKIGRPLNAAGTGPSTSVDMSAAGLRFQEFKGAGPHLRSQEMKTAHTMGQKKAKALEAALKVLNLVGPVIDKVDSLPLASEEIIGEFNELRTDILLLHELKGALNSCEYELEAQRQQYLAATGQDLEIPNKIRVSSDYEATEGTPKRKITDSLDLGQGQQPVRKRKAALEQNNMLKRLRRS